jgi:hypothetical protein
LSFKSEEFWGDIAEEDLVDNECEGSRGDLEEDKE